MGTLHEVSREIQIFQLKSLQLRKDGTIGRIVNLKLKSNTGTSSKPSRFYRYVTLAGRSDHEYSETLDELTDVIHDMELLCHSYIPKTIHKLAVKRRIYTVSESVTRGDYDLFKMWGEDLL